MRLGGTGADRCGGLRVPCGGKSADELGGLARMECPERASWYCLEGIE
jgi:hypothetical protein